jgi:hypothetical protein
MEANQSQPPEKQDGDDHDLVVTIHDEDAGGQPIKIEAEPASTVGRVIEQMYAKLKTQHQDGDRLRCEESGEDVFGHATEHLEAYAKHQCSKLEWLFARKTGGA